MSCSVSKDSKGYRIDYRYRGKKSAIRLGKRVSKKQYESFALKMASLIEARNLGDIDSPIDDALARWLAGLSDDIYGRLQGIGLCQKRRNSMPLVKFLEQYFADHSQLVEAAEGTKRIWKRAVRLARLHFGDSKMLQSVTEADAKQFRVFLLTQDGQEGRRMSDATARKMCAVVSQAFVEARFEGLIPSNPFERIPKGNVTNPEREVYVPEEAIDAIIAYAGDPEVRILLALSRYGALRIPSETTDLRWSDWDEDSNLLVVRSPKTKRHGKPVRSIPVFQKLRQTLKLNRPEGAGPQDHILPRLRLHTNPRMCVKRLLRELGIKEWPKCFHGLRASAVTDWSQRHGLADVANWAGHTPTVAVKHYLRAQEGKRLVALAKEVGGLSGDGTGGGTPSNQGLTPMVASAATNTDHEGPSTLQPSACHGIVNAADESCLLVGVAHQQVRTRGNGRRGIRTPVGISQQIYSLPSLAA